MLNSDGYSIEHIDPEIGRLVCGLDTPANKLLLDWDINRKKNNRFVPYRIDSRIPVHQEPGDWGFFLINGEWKLCKFMGKEWWEESERVGHNHSADIQSSRGKVGGIKGGAALKGRKKSEKTKQKIGLAHLGKVLSEETKEKLRQANLGKVTSEETKKLLSEKVKLAWVKRRENGTANRVKLKK